MQEKTRCIYLHRNKINGKPYIGQTVHQDDLNKRTYSNGNGYKGKNKNGNDSKFWRAIQKYGWDNFEHIFLEKDIPTLEIANKREQYWISFYDSYKNGYNSTLGGDGAKGRIVTEEEREYRSKLYSGSGNPMYGKRGELAPAYGKVMSKEQKEKISKSHIGIKASEQTKRKLSEIRKQMNLVGEKNPFYGHHHTQEVKDRLRHLAKERMALSENPFCKYKRTNDIRNQISKTLKEYYKIHDNPRKGKHWDEEHIKQMSERMKQDPVAMKRIVEIGKENSVFVNQYDLKGNFIKTYNSILEAENESGANHSVIIRCCKRHKNAKSASGYQWRYSDDCGDIGEVKYEVNNRGQCRKVEQYDKDMNLLKIWDSISEAANSTGLKPSNITAVCRGGKQKTSGGYIWRYAD